MAMFTSRDLNLTSLYVNISAIFELYNMAPNAPVLNFTYFKFPWQRGVNLSVLTFTIFKFSRQLGSP